MGRICMRLALGDVAFTVSGKPYSWEDVRLAAHFWDDWRVLREQVRQGLACVKRMQSTSEGPDAQDVRDAANEFRYEQDLISAQEMQAWLDERGLTVESWLDYIRRSLLRQRWSAELPAIASQYVVTDEEIDRAIDVEAVCSGRLTECSRKLAARAAVYDKLVEEADSAVAAADTEGERDTASEALTVNLLAEGLSGSCTAAANEKLAALVRLEAVFDDFCRRGQPARVVRDRISAQRLNWIRVECQCLLFPDEQWAREAALCITEDGKDLAEVAVEAKTAVRGASLQLGQLDPALRNHLMAARKGELVGPLLWEGQFALFLVTDKALPSERDPELRYRAEQEVLASVIEREIDKRVRLHTRL